MLICPVCKKQEGLIAALREDLTKTKQEFERFAATAVLDVTRKDQEIAKLNAEILERMEENERLDTNSGKTGRIK